MEGKMTEHERVSLKVKETIEEATKDPVYFVEKVLKTKLTESQKKSIRDYVQKKYMKLNTLRC